MYSVIQHYYRVNKTFMSQIGNWPNQSRLARILIPMAMAFIDVSYVATELFLPFPFPSPPVSFLLLFCLSSSLHPFLFYLFSKILLMLFRPLSLRILSKYVTYFLFLLCIFCISFLPPPTSAGSLSFRSRICISLSYSFLSCFFFLSNMLMFLLCHYIFIYFIILRFIYPLSSYLLFFSCYSFHHFLYYLLRFFLFSLFLQFFLSYFGLLQHFFSPFFPFTTPVCLLISKLSFPNFIKQFSFLGMVKITLRFFLFRNLYMSLVNRLQYGMTMKFSLETSVESTFIIFLSLLYRDILILVFNSSGMRLMQYCFIIGMLRQDDISEPNIFIYLFICLFIILYFLYFIFHFLYFILFFTSPFSPFLYIGLISPLFHSSEIPPSFHILFISLRNTSPTSSDINLHASIIQPLSLILFNITLPSLFTTLSFDLLVSSFFLSVSIPIPTGPPSVSVLALKSPPDNRYLSFFSSISFIILSNVSSLS
ncbi:Odorant receptor 431 [Nylanderia fulva]|uniref:Odorant receptor 431 n=1 Tax=Nylanderia fulva TaxID=613905 RepID=A0A6G1LP71_9HYME|nr:Odorant receptor 431 [Nylanderia fulva]